jgi:DcuC family C4-dicarboxylate transporter
VVALLSLVVIFLTVLALRFRAEVRLTLLASGLLLGLLAGQPGVIVQTFFVYLVRGQFLIPIGTSLGFAYVLRHTGCDRHLVHLLLGPVLRVRPLLIPGVVLVATLVNVPVVSQMSTAVLVGTVLVPLLRAAGISPVTTGAALLVGSSLGGEFLNPGSPELRSVSDAVGTQSIECVRYAAPLLVVQFVVATLVLWWLCARAEAGWDRLATRPTSASVPLDAFRINYLKALVPFAPLAMLFLTALPPPFRLIHIPVEWLVDTRDASPAEIRAAFDSRLIGASMLLGATLATVIDLVSGLRVRTWRSPGGSSRAFFEGVGYAFTHIISIIVCANCFGKGVEVSGLAEHLKSLIRATPGLLLPSAALFPLAFAWLCGSGMAATQSLIAFYIEPARHLGVEPLRVGAVVSLSASSGRTISPVAAVVLMSASLTDTQPLDLLRRASLPMLASTAAVVVAAMLLPR